MRIVPALLTQEKNDLEKMLSQAKNFADYLQIDFMDGLFVPSQSIPPQVMKEIKIEIPWEAHLMVKEPLTYLPYLKQKSLKRIIFHLEAVPQPVQVIDDLIKEGLEVGLGVNPETKIEEIIPYVHKISCFLFLSVNPGFYGSKYLPQVVEKIKTFRQQFSQIEIGIDGGIALENLLSVKEAGVNYACIGSRIFLAPDPKTRYQEFVKLAR